MQNYDVHIFDLDGVIYLGNKPIESAILYLNHLTNSGKQVYFFTNNASKTQQQIADKITKLGYNTTKDQIISSSSIAKHYLQSTSYKTAYLFGELGAKEALTHSNIEIINDTYTSEDILNRPDITVDIVLAGIFRQATYNDVACASLLIQRGAKFLATNTDPSIPIERGLFPGAGAFIKAIETASSTKPAMIFGKPNPLGITLLLEKLNISNEKAIIYGDRMDTDIFCGYSAHIHTALVLTGAMCEADIASYDFAPTHVVSSLDTLIK